MIEFRNILPNFHIRCNVVKWADNIQQWPPAQHRRGGSIKLSLMIPIHNTSRHITDPCQVNLLSFPVIELFYQEGIMTWPWLSFRFANKGSSMMADVEDNIFPLPQPGYWSIISGSCNYQLISHVPAMTTIISHNLTCHSQPVYTSFGDHQICQPKPKI